MSPEELNSTARSSFEATTWPHHSSIVGDLQLLEKWVLYQLKGFRMWNGKRSAARFVRSIPRCKLNEIATEETKKNGKYSIISNKFFFLKHHHRHHHSSCSMTNWDRQTDDAAAAAIYWCCAGNKVTRRSSGQNEWVTDWLSPIAVISIPCRLFSCWL